MKKSKILLLRHGQCCNNLGKEKDHTFAGQTDNELTPEGRVAAKKLAFKAKELGQWGLAVSSKLKRSKQTAEIIAESLSIPKLEIDNFEEIDVGKFAGQTEVKVKQLFPKEAALFYKGDIPNWRFPGGEDFSAISGRLDKVITQIRKIQKDYHNIIIAGHAMINRVLLYKIYPDKPEYWVNRSYPHDLFYLISDFK
jgi:broad specificity phosphatase PhoE